MTADAFAHLPGLRHRVTPAEHSALRMTPERIALLDANARAHGQPDNWRFSPLQLADSRHAVLGHWPPQHDLWVFGYGSLMWDPAVHFQEVRRADLPGYARSFCYRTILGRGTPACPALMLSLDPAEGCCHGLAFRLAAADVETETAMLWRREMIRGGYRPLLQRMATPQGEIDALVFVSNPAHDGYVGPLPLDETARTIATACGVLGSNRAYLELLAAQLDALGIEDRYIQRLSAQVQGLACA